MSTALVSAFYDVDILQQNRRNLGQQRSTSTHCRDDGLQRRLIGTPITGTGANRNRTTTMTIGTLQSDRYSPDEFTICQTGSPVLGHRDLNASSSLQNSRKLDRSVSEPCERANQRQQNVNSSRYKTELCRPYEENGYCKYGDKCQFAHGMHELRSLSRHPKYKTELCRTFHTIGFCPYGPRCHFIHNEDERKLNQINQLKQVPSPGVSQAPHHHMPPPTLTQSQPTSIQRPKALTFGISLPSSLVRDSLGSTADSPPSSVTDSPTMSPTFLGEDMIIGTFSPSMTASAPPICTSAFTFPGEILSLSAGHHHHPQPTIISPLNVQTDPLIASLTASLHAASLQPRFSHPPHHLTGSHDSSSASSSPDSGFYTPPSPPDSVSGDSIIGTCGSPLDVSRGLRLPIFSRFVSE